jgi:hypothetical protein
MVHEANTKKQQLKFKFAKFTRNCFATKERKLINNESRQHFPQKNKKKDKSDKVN